RALPPFPTRRSSDLSVPEYPDVGANSFTISLKRSANHIDIEYGGLTAAGGIAGVSCGGAVTSGFETPVDIGETNGRINLHNQPRSEEHTSELQSREK